MTKFSVEVVEKLLAKLEEATSILKDLQLQPEEAFKRDLIKWYALQHAFLIAIESVLDIGSHILSSVFKVQFDEYREIIPSLSEKGVLPAEFADKFKGMAEFRNKLVHEYPEIAVSRVYRYLQEHPRLFEEFAQYIKTFLAEQNG